LRIDRFLARRRSVNPTHPATPFVAHEEGQASQRPPLEGIECRFGLLLAVFGLVFLFSLPPVQVPDENVHFLHAYDVSKGHLLPAHDSEGWAGTTVPRELLRIQDPSHRFWHHPEARWTWQDSQELLNLRFTEEECPVSMAQVSIYTFLPYLPQAAGIRLAHWLHLPPLPLFYAGRLGNLFFGILCVMLAIRLAPIGKLLFGAVALFPLTVQQFASVSADGPTIGLSLILVAALLRLALSSVPRRKPAPVVGLLLLLMFATALTKFPYTLLILLYFGIAPGQVGSRRRYWLIGALVLAVTVAGLATSVALTRPFILDPHLLRDVPISKSGQIHFILTHPRQFFWIFLSNVADSGVFWVASLFTLGCMDTPMNPLVGLGYLFFLALLAVADRRRGELPWRLWWIGSAITLLSTTMILTALYVWWNPPGSNLLEGPQGRYFIPLMPLFFLLQRNGGIRVTADERFLSRMTLAVTAIFLIYAWTVLVNRFYFREPPVLLAPPALLGAGVLVLLLSWAKCRWDLAQATTNTAAPSASDASASSRPAA
jgi:uncharacterized membrane protein